MTLATLVSFSIFALMAAITPGPNNIMLAASGANYGFRRTLPHIIGVCFGFGCLVIAGGLGVGRFLETFPQFFSILKMLALLFLLYLVWKVGTASSPKLSPDGKPMRFHTAALFQWVNPKGVTVVISAIAAYLETASSIWQALPVMVIVFVLVTIISACLWAFIGSAISDFLSNRQYRIAFNVTMAIALFLSMLPAILSI